MILVFGFSFLSICGLVIISIGLIYRWMFAIAAISAPPKPSPINTHNRFAIVIPAHNEASIIGNTLSYLSKLNYPKNSVDIFVVADYCSDHTADIVRKHGAICYERKTGERGGKGSALRWLFEKILNKETQYDAVVVFDADTIVDPDFLHVINSRLMQGELAIQGKHVISNPQAGWFPALTWSMMTIDNRFSNLGRANLGLSAKHMGDSICFHTEIIKQFGWGKGLTEDYELRLILLLEGINIAYEPYAIGYGQAPPTWKLAEAQRLRWASGIAKSSTEFRNRLLREAYYSKKFSLLDGALGLIIPSYTTFSLISMMMLLIHLIFSPYLPDYLIVSWLVTALLWFIYPFIGLLLEKAPAWSYLSILTGPVFMGWRSWINIRAKLSTGFDQWIRTPH